MKMNKLGTLILTALLITSCASTRMLKQQTQYELQLKRLVNSEMNLEDKVDGVAEIFDDVLQQSLEYSSDKNTTKHIDQFVKKNKSTINVLLDQIEGEMGKMNTVEQIQFSIRVLRQPYIKSFVSIVPKVEKKINRKLRQIQMFGRFIKIVKPSLF